MPLITSAKKPVNEPTFMLNLQESGPISIVHFSHYELSQDLLLVALSNKILLAHLVFQDNLELKRLAEFSNGVACTALTFSPETTLNTLPALVLFCSAGNDFKLRIFKSDLAEDNTCKILSGHSDYINEISYDPENNFIASVSDDNTAKVWSTSDYACVATLYLSSAGMSICWHRDDASKLMVAEKIGLVRFYNVNTQKPILSLDFGKPLAAAHWSPSDSQLVCSLHLGELVLWDLTRPSRPSHVKLLHSLNGGFIKMNSLSELVATVNRLEGCIKVSHVNTQQQRLSASVLLPTNITWHFRLPILCLGDDTKLCFWKEFPWWTVPPDVRFPNQNASHFCFQMFVDYQRCIRLLGTGHEPCTYFKKAYASLCPNVWVAKWTEQIADGSFCLDLPDCSGKK